MQLVGGVLTVLAVKFGVEADQPCGTSLDGHIATDQRESPAMVIVAIGHALVVITIRPLAAAARPN